MAQLPPDHDQIALLETWDQRTLSFQALLHHLTIEAVEIDSLFVQQFYKCSTDIVVILDLNKHILRVNPVFYQTFGYSKEELARLPVSRHIHPEDLGKTLEAINTIKNLQPVNQFSHRCFSKDGTLHWLQWKAYPDPEGQIVCAIGRDITEQKSIEQKILEQHCVTQEICANLPALVYVYDREQHAIVYSNQAAHQFYNLSEDNFNQTTLEWLMETIHPDDRERLVTDYQRIHSTNCKDFLGEYRCRNAHGQWRWLRNHSVVFKRKLDGTPSQILGTAIDVTDQKLTELALQKSEARYRDLVQQETELVCRYTPDFVTTFVNDAYARTFGKSYDELVGRNFVNLIVKSDWEAARQHVAQLTPEYPVASHEHRSYLQDGSECWFEWTDRAFFDEQGDAIEYQAIGRDVTERHQLSEALRFVAQLGWMMESSQFYEALAKYLWRALGTKYVFIAKLLTPTSVETVALLENGELTPDMQYSLRGTPCDSVIGKRLCYYPEQIRQRYPEDHLLQEMTAESYMGVPLWDSTGKAIGLIALIHDRPFRDSHLAESLLQILAVRTSQELEHCETEKQIRESEQRFRTLFYDVPAGIAMIDESGQIVLANHALETMFGFEPGNLQGVIVEDLIPTEKRDFHARMRQQSFQMPYSHPLGKGMESYGQRKDGQHFPIEVSLSFISTHEGVRTIAIVSDMSARHQIEQARLAEHNLKLELEKERELRELKSRFISMVSHEFRTPMSIIMTSTDLLRKRTGAASAEEIHTRLDRIEAQIHRLNRMIEDVTTVNRYEMAATSRQLSPILLCSFLEKLSGEISQVYDHTIPIHFEKIGDCLQAEFDEDLLLQIFTNLLTNAVKYSLPGGTVTVFCECQPEAVTVFIQDQGIGIPPAEQQRLFTPFYRAGNVGNISGTGLGLVIVSQAVKALGGSISFQSAPGVGTTFAVCLPVVRGGKQ